MTYLPESEFNRIVLTHSKGEWISETFFLCRKNKYKLTEIQFNKLCKSQLDPSWIACYVIKNGYADVEWAKKVIENAKAGDPSWAAYMLVKNEYADSEWAKKVIENAKSGDPSLAAFQMVAFQMVEGGYADSKWAKKVIENDKIEYSKWAAYRMVAYGFADQSWYEKVTGMKFK